MFDRSLIIESTFVRSFLLLPPVGENAENTLNKRAAPNARKTARHVREHARRVTIM